MSNDENKVGAAKVLDAKIHQVFLPFGHATEKTTNDKGIRENMLVAEEPVRPRCAQARQ